MPKTRLLVRHKEALKAFAKRSTESGVDTSKVDQAYKVAASLVRPIVDHKFPVRDMKVLKKYNAGRDDHCVRMVAETGQVIGFTFRRDDAPYLPSAYCSTRGFPASKEVVSAIEAHSKAEDDRKKEVTKILTAYRVLIDASKTVGEIIDAWPGCREVAEKMLSRDSTALVAVTPETLKIIQSTNLGAQAA